VLANNKGNRNLGHLEQALPGESGYWGIGNPPVEVTALAHPEAGALGALGLVLGSVQRVALHK
jgi:hypothetical protein